MKVRPTILNVPAAIFLIACLVYTVVKYQTLAYAEGWGIAFMIGLGVFGMTAFVVDLIIQNVIKSPKMRWVIRIIALAIYSVLIVLGFNGN